MEEQKLFEKELLVFIIPENKRDDFWCFGLVSEVNGDQVTLYGTDDMNNVIDYLMYNQPMSFWTKKAEQLIPLRTEQEIIDVVNKYHGLGLLEMGKYSNYKKYLK